MPGVITTTSTRPGGTNTSVPPSGRYFVVGQAERGRTDVAQLVKSFAEFEALYGNRVTYGFLSDAARVFFGEGGGEMVVARVVGPAAVKSTITVNDRAGSPLPTVRFDALSAGAWANGWKIVIAAGTLANTVRATVQDASSSNVETFDNLGSPAAIATALNSSGYVRAVDLVSVTAAPNNLPATGTYTLAAGTDDRASITGAHYVAALALFDKKWGAGLVDVTGIAATTVATASTVGAGLIDHARNLARIAALNPGSGVAYTQAISDAATFTAGSADCAGLFWPWVRLRDGVSDRSISPGPYVAACRARAHLEETAQRAPAGEIARAVTLVGVDTDVTDAIGEIANDARVSVVRTILGDVRLYGYRSLSTDDANYRHLSVRDFLNTLVHEGSARLEKYVFATIDGSGALFRKIEGELTGMMDSIARKGGVYERWNADRTRKLDPGYKITVDLDPLNSSKLRVRLYVRVSPTAEMIELNITYVGLTAGI